MATDVLTDIDLNKNQLLNPAVHNANAFPDSPAEGQLVVKDHGLYAYLNGAWKLCTVQIATDAQASAGTAEDVAINPKQYALKAPLASPAFTGTPTVPTAATGTNTTQAASTEFVQTEIAAATLNAKIYKGQWNTTNQTDYSALNSYRPIKAGWYFTCTGTGCTIDGVEYRAGDAITFNSNVASGATITTAVIDKTDNTESDDLVRLNATQTLTGKTIDADDNTVKDLAVGCFKSGEVIASVTQNSGKLITSGGVYSALQGYQTKLTFGTGLTNSGGTVSVNNPFIALAAGSIAYGGSGGVLTELPIGTQGYVLTAGANGLPIWAQNQSTIKKESYTNPALTPSNGKCTWTIDHTIGTRECCVEIYNASTYKKVVVDVVHTSTSQLTVEFNASGNVSAGTYKAVLIG